MSLRNDPEFMSLVRDASMSTRDVERETGTARSYVAALRRELAAAAGAPKEAGAPEGSTQKASVAYDGNGGGTFDSVVTDQKITDWSHVFAKFGLDPDRYSIVENTVRCSTWQQSKRLENGERDVIDLYSYRAQFQLRTPDEEPMERLIERMRTFEYVPAAAGARSDESFVLVPTDLQIGKVDWNGGSDDTFEQVLTSFHKARDIVRETRPREVAIVDAGDIIENIYNTSSQLGTNDLDLPHQVEQAMHAILTGIELLAPEVPSLRYAAVSSNHGAHRLGPKSPAGDAHADYGIVIANLIGRALSLNREAFGHVTVQTPEPYMESLAFTTSRSRIGVVHSHQAGHVDKIGDWWKGQSHGNMPTADARILIAGHWHSLRVQHSGDARWIMVGSASDRGSSWFTNLKGEQSQSGMMSFFTADNTWHDLAIL